MVFMLPVTAFAGGGGSSLEERIQALIEQNRALMEQNRSLARRLEAVENKLAHVEQKSESGDAELAREIEEQSKAAEDAWYNGITLSGGMTGVVQGTANNSDNNPEGGNQADAAYTFDLNLDADFNSYGRFHLFLEGGDGEGINNNVPSFSVPNYDAYATWNNENLADITISEAYYENSFFDDRFIFDIGKMDISVLFDENEVAGDETTQFLSNIFVKSMGVVIPEPDEFYAPAMLFTGIPSDMFELKLLLSSVDTSHGHVWENIFSNGFIAGQVNFRPGIGGRQGNYRFYGWYDSRRYLDSKYLSSPGSHRADENRSGFGLSFDQEIMDSISLFARYSWTDDDIAVNNDHSWEMLPINQMYTVGVGIGGYYWSRPDDNIGIGFGQTILTDDYEDANSNTSNESYMETYYRYVFNQNLALTADFQWIHNPGGSSDADDAYIFGLRSQIDF
jgi:hypothetical protein